MPLGPNTPATLIILAGSILLVLSTISNPIIKSFYFLSIKVASKVASIPLDGNIRLGTFAPLNPIISALTYALILHPIAAGLALISAIFGLVSHIREYSRSRYTSCFSSLASTAALLAFVLDIVAFSIAKKRLNALSDTNVAIDSQLGNAVWVTLAGWICLTLSGVYQKMRTDADEAEKAREDAFTHKQSQSSLPAFAEYTNQHTNQEHIPLNRFNPNEQDLYSAQHHQVHSPDSFPSEHLDGVGMGYHQPPHHPLNTSQPSTDQGTAYHSLAASFLPPMPPQHTGTPTGDMYSHLPSHVSPALNTMNSPHQTPSSLTNRRLPPSLMPAGGLETRSSSYTSVPPSQLVGISGARPLHGPRTNSYASPGPSSQSHGARTSLPYPSYNRATAHPTQAHDPSLVDPLQYNQAGNTGQPPVNFPNPQPNHQTSTNPAVLGNYPHQNSHAYANPPSVMIQPGNHYTPQAFSDEPSQLSDLNAQPPVHHNTNLLNSSGPQFTNHNLFYSQATLHQDEHLNPSGSQSDNHSSFYSQATSNTTSNTVYSPQPYQLPNQLIGLAQGNIDEQDMYGGTAPTPSPEHPAPQNQLAHPPALPPLSFSPPPSHQSSSPPPAVTQPLHNHNHHPTPPSYS
ncbi:hypothetical protein PSHT_03578 [Puccinia striiformis]|uniref:Uncharacterized protein n=1 Tax=Puccinia striiformis TaxID=27350 RepID=A0A2S4WEZ8_9BASI|nr:hypothetical protein PSHT_03578 [Puccinia striiformis]